MQHPRRQLARAGVQIREAVGNVGLPTSAAADDQADALPRMRRRGRANVSPVLAQLPDALPIIPCGFAAVPIAAGITIATGESAWFGLLDRDIDTDFILGAALHGVSLEMCSCDINGVGGGIAGSTTPRAWGNAKGEGAAIVIGVDLPTKGKTDGTTWVSAPCGFPGVDNVALPNLNRGTAIGRTFMSFGFPPGAYNDPVPYRQKWTRSLQPMLYRIRPGESLCVALVVARSVVHNLGAGANLFGSVSIECHLGSPDPIQPFPNS